MAFALSGDVTQLIVLALAMAGAGVFAGFIAGLLGVGGGIVVVPAVFEVLRVMETAPDVRMHVAVGTSLATIVATATRSARAHHRRGAVDGELLKSWGPAVLAGVALGSAISGVVSGRVLTGIFGVVALLVAVYMASFGNRARLADHLPGQPLKSLLAVTVGLISSLMGIGGGTLSVPILSLCSYPIRYAVGTSSAIGLIIAVPGTIGFMIAGWGAPGLPPYSIGFVNPVAFAAIVPTTVLVAPLGARAAHAIPQTTLRLLFAAFLGVMAVRMLLETAGISVFGGG
jgi:uncharacterized membrane protein YfcA